MLWIKTHWIYRSLIKNIIWPGYYTFIYNHSIFINEVFFGGFSRPNEFWLRPLVYQSLMHIACFQYQCKMATILSHFLTVCCSCIQIQCIFILLIYQEKNCQTFFFSFWKKRNVSCVTVWSIEWWSQRRSWTPAPLMPVHWIYTYVLTCPFILLIFEICLLILLVIICWQQKSLWIIIKYLVPSFQLFYCTL